MLMGFIYKSVSFLFILPKKTSKLLNDQNDVRAHTQKMCRHTKILHFKKTNWSIFRFWFIFMILYFSFLLFFYQKYALYIFSDGIATKETRAIKANVPSKMNVKKKRLERTIRDVWIWIRDNENWNLKPFRLAADVIF